MPDAFRKRLMRMVNNNNGDEREENFSDNFYSFEDLMKEFGEK
ncbi:MAG: hypothetical protein V1831_02400 [Candidatus Woesearchaeota archaeon]